MWGLPWALLGTSFPLHGVPGLPAPRTGSSSHLPATLSLLSEIGETQGLGNLFLLVLHVAGAGSRAGQTAWAAGDFFC